VACKGIGFTAAIHPMLEAEIAAWVRSLQQSATAAQAGGGPIQPHNWQDDLSSRTARSMCGRQLG
jgi:hypothetical protein